MSLKNKKSNVFGFDLAGLKVVLFIVFTLAIFARYIFDKLQSETLPLEYIQHTLTHLVGTEKEAKFSPDGKSVAFAHSDEDTDDEHLFLIDLVTRQPRQITNSPIYLLRLAWSPDSTRIIYSYWKSLHDRQCAINLITLNENNEVINNRKILECSEGSLVYLAWNESSETIYFNSRPSIDRPYSVNSYSLKTDRTAQLALSPQKGDLKGDYSIIGNLSGSRIMIARYIGTNELDMRFYDTRTDSLLSSNTVTDSISGITWLGNSEELLLTIDNKLYRYDYLNKKKQFYYLVNRGFSSFASDSDAKNLIFTSTKIDVNLYSFDLLSGQVVEQVTDLTSDELMPAYANTTDAIAFLSDHSGRTQIWLKDAQGQSYQVSDSPVSLGLTPLNWSQDDRFILFQHQEEVFLLNVNNHSIERIIDKSHKSQVANWSWSGNSVFYASEKSGEWQIWQYFLSSGKHLQVTFEGGYSAHQHKNGDLYFSKIHQSGIWKLIPDSSSEYGFTEQMKVLDNFDETNGVSWQLLGNELYFIAAEEQRKGLFRYNVHKNTGHLVLPFTENYLPYFSVKGNMAIFTIIENKESSIELFKQVD